MLATQVLYHLNHTASPWPQLLIAEVSEVRGLGGKRQLWDAGYTP
jgi:hypothetical protein